MNFQELTKSINQFLVKMHYGTYTVRFRDVVEFLQSQQGHHDQDVTISSRNRFSRLDVYQIRKKQNKKQAK